ncbi:MAG: YicC/YloC family endoribonuclease, partial [candidate division Zixibacteria bacterium]
MTGFGKAELKTKSGRYTVEITSVNNRFLEISQRLPRQFFI